ncbi:uncharacterized protein LOC132619521 [Lycium barbarum]|uniref:uncharacterized protein LOC132619521 n=1 Tax=Lycium barbarum TaxID=112863 RepID=UPI00293EA91B|nr:uncharacterized protein LOC132619521 [Lycium barbarum]
MDNVLIPHELVKGYSHKGISARCTIKVDIRKAYDSVEWPFLKMVLLEFGFPSKLVDLIMECVTIVQYSLLVNGGLTPLFKAKKGLRKGDSMCPYLFVLAMEYLHRTLADENSIKLLFNTFKHFSKLSGLHVNMEKSSLDIAGVTDLFKEQMLQGLNLTLGELPFKYLGVPLSTRKLSIHLFAYGGENDSKEKLLVL